MEFGMGREAIETTVFAHLIGERPGGTQRFNEYEARLIAQVMASVIVENNQKIQYALGNAGIDFK